MQEQRHGTPSIILLHYHLRPGGVTKVMEQQARALDALGYPWLGLVGHNPKGIPGFQTLERLNYDVYLQDSLLDEERRYHNLSADIHQAIQAWKTSDSPVIIHAHNVTLEKNTALLPALQRLQSMGYRFLLQLHDFAEDGRPQVYSPEDYPQDCHFAVINSRDFRALMQAGLSSPGLHRLPNQVSPLPLPPPREPANNPTPAGSSSSGSLAQSLGKSRLILYPVRAIRRKNIGEVILLSRILEDTALAVTLPPNNPADNQAYRFWQDLVRSLDAPVRLGAGEQWAFEDLVAQADSFLSTSVQEGFGFAFLEPWTIQKPVGGRYLEMVCPDFEHQGMRLSHLYTSIRIPLSWFNTEKVRQDWLGENRRRIKAFYQVVAKNPDNQQNTLQALELLLKDLPDRWSRLVQDGTLDFAILPREEQAGIITRLSPENRADKDHLRALNPQLAAWPLARSAPPLHQEVVAGNTRVVTTIYSAEAYANRLSQVYSQVLQDHLEHSISKTSLLLSFLNPEGLYLSAL